jgi:hypothetical protein
MVTFLHLDVPAGLAVSVTGLWQDVRSNVHALQCSRLAAAAAAQLKV